MKLQRNAPAPPTGLIVSIYEAGCDADLWSEVLRHMLQWLGGVAGAITRHDFESNQVQMLYAFGYEPERLRDYTLRYAAEDAWLRSATPYQQTGRVLTGQEILSDSELVRSSFYQEWLKPQGLHHRLCGVLSRDRVTTLLIALMRPSSAPAFDSAAARRLRGILPHLRRALAWQDRLATLEIERRVACDALDLLPIGVLHVDAGGQILAANARANEFLRAADGISNQDGILRTGRTEDVTKLRQLISVAGPTADRATTEIGGVLNIRRASGRRPLQMLVTPVRGSRERLGEQRPRATVFIADPDMALERNEERLRRLYGLTHAEARLVQAFAHHGSIEQAAAAAGIALSTARAYLKRIFVKAGVTRQTELLRLILCGPAALRSIGVCRQPRI